MAVIEKKKRVKIGRSYEANTNRSFGCRNLARRKTSIKLQAKGSVSASGSAIKFSHPTKKQQQSGFARKNSGSAELFGRQSPDKRLKPPPPPPPKASVAVDYSPHQGEKRLCAPLLDERFV